MESTQFSTSEISSLGQILDTTFGRTSTAESATASIKTTLHGKVLTVKYSAIVHFSSEESMRQQKPSFDNESVKLTDDYMKAIRKQFKEKEGRALKVKQMSTDDDIEIISAQGHISPRKVAYYRRVTAFEIS